MAKIDFYSIEVGVPDSNCEKCWYLTKDLRCGLFNKKIKNYERCKTCLQHEIEESKKTNKILEEMQRRCNLDLDLEEFKNFKQIQAKLADTETNLAIAQDDRKFLKKENARLSVENTELKKQLADLQKNTAEAIGGIYNGHFSAQEQFVIYVKREMNKIFEPFISKDDNDTED